MDLNKKIITWENKMRALGFATAAGLTTGLTNYFIQLSGTPMDSTSSIILGLGVAVGFVIGHFHKKG